MRTFKNFEECDQYIVTDKIKNNNFPPGSILYIIKLLQNCGNYPNTIKCQAVMTRKGYGKPLKFVSVTISASAMRSDMESMKKVLPIGNQELVDIERIGRPLFIDENTDKFQAAMWIMMKSMNLVQQRCLEMARHFHKTQILKRYEHYLSRLPGKEANDVFPDVNIHMLKAWLEEVMTIKSAIVRQEIDVRRSTLACEEMAIQNIAKLNSWHFKVMSDDLLDEVAKEVRAEQAAIEKVAKRLMSPMVH